MFYITRSIEYEKDTQKQTEGGDFQDTELTLKTWVSCHYITGSEELMIVVWGKANEIELRIGSKILTSLKHMFLNRTKFYKRNASKTYNLSDHIKVD